MPRNTSRVTVDSRRLQAIIRNSGRNARTALRNVAFTVERLAKQYAPVDLGPLRAGIYTAMSGDNNPPDISEDVIRVWLPDPEGDLVAHVGPSVDYGIYQELGTREMAAQPFLLPALREAEGVVPAEFRNVATDGN